MIEWATPHQVRAKSRWRKAGKCVRTAIKCGQFIQVLQLQLRWRSNKVVRVPIVVRWRGGILPQIREKVAVGVGQQRQKAQPRRVRRLVETLCVGKRNALDRELKHFNRQPEYDACHEVHEVGCAMEDPKNSVQIFIVLRTNFVGRSPLGLYMYTYIASAAGRWCEEG